MNESFKYAFKIMEDNFTNPTEEHIIEHLNYHQGVIGCERIGGPTFPINKTQVKQMILGSEPTQTNLDLFEVAFDKYIEQYVSDFIIKHSDEISKPLGRGLLWENRMNEMGCYMVDMDYLCKVIERCVKTKIRVELDEILSKHKHGFEEEYRNKILSELSPMPLFNFGENVDVVAMLDDFFLVNSSSVIAFNE